MTIFLLLNLRGNHLLIIFLHYCVIYTWDFLLEFFISLLLVLILLEGLLMFKLNIGLCVLLGVKF